MSILDNFFHVTRLYLAINRHFLSVCNEHCCSVILAFFTFLQVTDSKGHVLYNKEDATKGKFAFTTEEYDVFEVCFESKMMGGKSELKKSCKQCHTGCSSIISK